jgi:tRNA(Ile)-lysidine synthase
LLAEAARAAGFDTIVTAHHQDDQAETFLLRLARGSGVYGLAAMADRGTVDGIALERPLLGVTRARLRQVAASSGLRIVEDPSNSDPRFDRVRVRSALPSLAEIGLTVSGLSETAARLRRAASALDHYATLLLRESFQADSFGVVRGRADALSKAPEEIGLRALALILKAVGGAEYTARLDSIEALYAALVAATTSGAVKRTLSGVVVSLADGAFTAAREIGRARLDEIAAPAGATLLWDRRFEVEVPKVAGVLSVAALARSEPRLRGAAADRGAIDALPGLYRAGRLIAAPPAAIPAGEGERLAKLSVECVVGRRLGLVSGAAASGR